VIASPAAGILAGLRVVELSAFVAVPLGGATLAALGAEVIRIDPIGGGLDIHRFPTLNGTSLYWAGLNGGKRSVTLNLRSEQGRSLVRRLVASGGPEGGIVITNLSARGWASYEGLRQIRPDLLMIVLRGNPDGAPAVDYTVNARLGFPMVTGTTDEALPVNHVLPAWDAMAGYLVALAVLSGERHRTRTGNGQLVRLSLMDVALSTAARLGFVAEAQLIPDARGRFGNFVNGTFGRDFPTADGRRIMVVALTPRQWQNLVEATELSVEFARLEARSGLRFVDETARWEARDEIAALIEHWTARRDLAELATVFDRHGVLWSPYQTFKQAVAEDADYSSTNPLFTDVAWPGFGRHLVAGSPLEFEAFPRVAPVPPPRLGEHTKEVLEGILGLSVSEVDDLIRDGVAAG
jgi:2-methylfumaryl-CoA isomerase